MEKLTAEGMILSEVEKALRNLITNVRFEIGGPEGRKIAAAIKRRFNLGGEIEREETDD